MCVPYRGHIHALYLPSDKALLDSPSTVSWVATYLSVFLMFDIVAVRLKSGAKR